MSGLEEISVERREDENTKPRDRIEEGPTLEKENLQSISDFGHLGEDSGSIQGPAKETEAKGLSRRSIDGIPLNVGPPTQEDHRARFYEHYGREAREYDEALVRKYDESMDSTLIFGGFFSIVTAIFTVQIQSQLQLDPSQETVALLRVLIYKIDNTTFGGIAPTPLQWAGPSRTITQVQCLLYASLTTSFLACFFAMLGKQWLSRYVSVCMRGSIIERNQDRQRKLDGLVAWYFDLVLESLPLLLQVALLLLGCALSRYLWEIDITVASVVLGMTSLGILLYFFILVAGVTSYSCPYQTPAAYAIRHFPLLFRPAYTRFVEHSEMYDSSVAWWSGASKLPVSQVIRNILAYPFVLLVAFAADVVSMGRATSRLLVNLSRRARGRPFPIPPVLGRDIEDPQTKLDFRCFSWMTRAPLDNTTKASTLNFLGTILSLASLNSPINSAVIVDCFNVLRSCFIIGDGGAAVVAHGCEQLAEISAMCFLRAFSSLSTTDPTSPIVADMRQQYERAFPFRVDLRGFSRPVIMNVVHHLFAGPRDQMELDWKNYDPPVDELAPLSRALSQAAQFEYYGGGAPHEVPRWMIRFSLRFLPLAPALPTSVTGDCLTIIATDLGCAVPDTNGMTLSESGRAERLFNLIIREYDTIVSGGRRIPEAKGEATIALLPYAARWEERGTALPLSLKYAVVDAFRHSHSFLEYADDISTMMQLWVAAGSALPYADDVCESMVDALLQMASRDNLRPHIPVVAWEWFKKRPVLRPDCQGLKFGTRLDVFRTVQDLGDLELTTSYLLVVWSESSWLYPEGCTAMLDFVWGGLRGVEKVQYQTDLIQRLDDVLSRMDPESPTASEAVGNIVWYKEFKEALVEANEEALQTLAGSTPAVAGASSLPSP